MKKISALLINPYIHDFTLYDFWIKPIGLFRLAYALKKIGFKINFIDLLDMSDPSIPEKFKKRKEDGTGKFYFEFIIKPEILPKIERRFKRYGLPVQIFKEKLKKIKKINIIFITSYMTYWYPGVFETIEILRGFFGKVPVILGGIYPTLCFEHSLKSGADFVLSGHFEEKLPFILKEIFGTNFSFDFEIYPDYLYSWEKNSLPIFTSKGCPCNCNWCASRVIEPKFIQYELDYLLKIFLSFKKFKTKNVAFYDDALLTKKDFHIKPILKKLKEKNINFYFHTPNGIDPNEIDFEIVRLFKECNFKTIRLSVDILDKKIKFEKLKEIMEMFFKVGFKRGEIEAYILLGFPEQNFEKLKEDLIKLNEIGITTRFAYFSPIPKTSLWEFLEKKGYVKKEEDPLLSNKILFPYRFKGIDPQELKELKRLQNNLNQKFLTF